MADASSGEDRVAQEYDVARDPMWCRIMRSAVAHRAWLVGALLVGLASYSFFCRIDSVPADVNDRDVCINIDNAKRVAEGDLRTFFTHGSREPAVAHIGALSFPFTDDHHLGLKLALGTVGLLTVLLGFVLMRQVFGLFVSSVFSIFLATSYWFVALQRNGYRAMLAVAPFILIVFALASLSRKPVSETRRFALSAVCALGLALGLYSYTAFASFVPFLFLLLAIKVYFSDDDETKSQLALFTLQTLAFFIIFAAPLLVYIARSPELFGARAIARLAEIDARAFGLSEYVSRFLNVYRVSLISIFRDGYYRFFQRGIYPVFVPLALLGLVLTMYRGYRSFVHAMLVATFFFAPLMSTLYSIGFETEVPELPRLILALPCIALFVAFGAKLVADWLARGVERLSRFDGRRLAACHGTGIDVTLAIRGTLVAAIAIASATWLHDYLFEWFPTAYSSANYPVYKSVMRTIDRIPPMPVVLVGDFDVVCVATIREADYGFVTPEELNLDAEQAVLVFAWIDQVPELFNTVPGFAARCAPVHVDEGDFRRPFNAYVCIPSGGT